MLSKERHQTATGPGLSYSVVPKLAAEQRARILKRIDAGESAKEIAIDYGFPEALVLDLSLMERQRQDASRRRADDMEREDLKAQQDYLDEQQKYSVADYLEKATACDLEDIFKDYPECVVRELADRLLEVANERAQ